MTISSNTASDVYSGTGSLDIFSYTFRILADADILVQIKDTAGAITTKTITTHYTVSGAGDAAGGTITFGTPPLSTDTVILTRDMDFLQSTDYTENSALPAETLEEDMDKGVMISQQLKEESDRTVKVDSAVTGFDATLPTPVASKIIGFNAAADGLAVVNVVDLGGVAIAGTTVGGGLTFVDENNLGVSTRITATDGTKLDTVETSADVTDETNVVSSLDGATIANVTVATGDKVVIQDITASDALKTVTAQSIADLSASGGGAWDWVSTTTLSNDAAIAFTGLTDKAYKLEMFNVLPQTDDVYFRIEVSNDNGVGYETDNCSYAVNGRSTRSGLIADVSATSTTIVITDTGAGDKVGNNIGANEYGISGEIKLLGTSDAAAPLTTSSDIIYQDGSGATVKAAGGGRSSDDAAGGVHLDIDAVRVSFNTGNMVSGTIELYSLRTS